MSCSRDLVLKWDGGSTHKRHFYVFELGGFHREELSHWTQLVQVREKDPDNVGAKGYHDAILDYLKYVRYLQQLLGIPSTNVTCLTNFMAICCDNCSENKGIHTGVITRLEASRKIEHVKRFGNTSDYEPMHVLCCIDHLMNIAARDIKVAFRNSIANDYAKSESSDFVTRLAGRVAAFLNKNTNFREFCQRLGVPRPQFESKSWKFIASELNILACYTHYAVIIVWYAFTWYDKCTEAQKRDFFHLVRPEVRVALAIRAAGCCIMKRVMKSFNRETTYHKHLEETNKYIEGFEKVMNDGQSARYLSDNVARREGLCLEQSARAVLLQATERKHLLNSFSKECQQLGAKARVVQDAHLLKLLGHCIETGATDGWRGRKSASWAFCIYGGSHISARSFIFDNCNTP